ncbi:MAG: hypothetical protein IPJ27_05395 [Candidatus Accumulibacter sp.]|uniref:Uncharacterized protein n=1 Tax=Candidatus Accumulibacter proximus TaxID=2954385 RepID=A0A935PWZ0_9PROT|nr:hypothetical protein [Candidatus Accumulibacter proximus]
MMMNEGAMGTLGHLMSKPVTQGAATGAAAAAGGVVGRTLLVNPLTLLAVGVAGGVVAGYLLHRYRKEIALTVSKACGIGKDFALQQKESLADLIEEAKENEARAAQPAAAGVDAPATQAG